MQTYFLCPVKKKKRKEEAVRRMSDVFLMSADLTRAQRWCCTPHSVRQSFSEHLSKTEAAF